MNMRKILTVSISLVCALTLLFSACGVAPAPAPAETPDAGNAPAETPEALVFDGEPVPELTEDAPFIDVVELEDIEIEEETVALSESAPALPTLLVPVASGTATKGNENAVIDYSNTADGYVMVQYTAQTEKKLKAQVKGQTTYTYTIVPGQWTTFPLSDGSGSYQVTVYQNAYDNKYATVVSASFTAEITDEFAPYLRPNQYVNYETAPNTVAKAAELTSGTDNVVEKVEAVYDFVVTNFSYDYALAATVKSGYLPDLDTVLEKKTGICFDYAAVMTGMLRSQSVPCKLVVGYAGSAYHAWISVYSEENGWIDGAIFFNGKTWMRMDPTFASNGSGSDYVKSFISNDTNYSAKYFY